MVLKPITFGNSGLCHANRGPAINLPQRQPFPKPCIFLRGVLFRYTLSFGRALRTLLAKDPDTTGYPELSVLAENGPALFVPKQQMPNSMYGLAVKEFWLDHLEGHQYYVEHQVDIPKVVKRTLRGISQMFQT